MESKTSDEKLRDEFEALYGPMGFDLTRWVTVAPEPWAEYDDEHTGYAWAGYLAASSARSEEMEADKRDAERYRFLCEQEDDDHLFIVSGRNGAWGECGHSDFGGMKELVDKYVDEGIAARAALTPTEKPAQDVDAIRKVGGC